MSYRMPPHIVAGLGGTDPHTLGIPSEDEYIAAYCARTGRSAIADFGFYLAFNFFRLAAIFHGIKGRVIRGTAASAEAHERAKAFPELAALALAQTRRSEEHTSELQSLMRISYAVFCLKKKNKK